MFKHFALISLVLLSLAACGSSEAPVNLQGDWSNDEMAAVISEDTIRIDIVGQEGVRALYWEGTFEAPDDFVDGVVVESMRKDGDMDSSLLASGAKSKQFKFEEGQLSYDFTALGVTKTIVLERR